MTSKTNRSVKRTEGLKLVREESPNWIVIAGGAILSTLSIRICCKLKQIFDLKKSRKTHAPSNDNGILTPNKSRETCKLHSQLYCFARGVDGRCTCLSGAKHTPMSPMSKDADDSLTLVKVPSAHSSLDNGVTWGSSPDQLELPPKSSNHPNSLDSPCISEFGSDIHNKREVVQKLRQQLKRRDDMIMEMQAQITYLQNSLSTQITHSSELRAQLDSSNQQLLYAVREIQRLQKIISDHGADVIASPEKSLPTRLWQPKAANGHANGCVDGCNDAELHCAGVGSDRIGVLKREVKELKEVIVGKEFLIQSYKEQKMELCSRMKELPVRLASQSSTPNILENIFVEEACFDSL